MRGSLVRYQSNPPAKISGTTILFGIALVGLIIWLIFKNKSSPISQYKNLETWDIEWTSEGLPAKVTIHRKATRE